MNTQDPKYHQKSKCISSPERNYFAGFAMRYPVCFKVKNQNYIHDFRGGHSKTTLIQKNNFGVHLLQALCIGIVATQFKNISSGGAVIGSTSFIDTSEALCIGVVASQEYYY